MHNVKDRRVLVKQGKVAYLQPNTMIVQGTEIINESYFIVDTNITFQLTASESG